MANSSLVCKIKGYGNVIVADNRGAQVKKFSASEACFGRHCSLPAQHITAIDFTSCVQTVGYSLCGIPRLVLAYCFGQPFIILEQKDWKPQNMGSIH